MTPRADELEDGENHLSATSDDDDSSSDDEGLKEDMAALYRACTISSKTTTGDGDFDGGGILSDDPLLCSGDAIVPLNTTGSSSDSDNEDLECLKRVTILYQPLASLPPPLAITTTDTAAADDNDDDDDDEDDFETLRAIRARFSSYIAAGMETLSMEDWTSSLGHGGETANGSISDRWDVGGMSAVSQNHDKDTEFLTSNTEVEHSSLIESDKGDAFIFSKLPQKSSSFPPSARAFVDAINKNRSMQKFLGIKLREIEAKIEANKKLRDRVKVLKDFQAACIRKTRSALSLKKDPRVQLISAKKSSAPNNSKSRNKKISAMCYGPAENSHVPNYKKVLERFPLSLDRKKWTNAERENLEKGIKQQFQEMVLQTALDRMSSECSDGYANNMDSITASVHDLEITPEEIKKFIPQVNWDKLASTYDVGHTGAECLSRWSNYEDPLVNHGKWVPEEDNKLLCTVQQMGIRQWDDIAKSLGTNRTAFQCLARYQRSLNASVLHSEWTEEEDTQLCSAVAIYGEHDWQSVASVLDRRTGTQCSNRWKKSLFPERKGNFTQEEDERLTVAVMLFGRKWNQAAKYVPGRTQAQCRDRYVNSLDPSLKWGGWTKEEDSRLKAAIAKHGFCWSKVAGDMPPRTDSQCRKRWKVLSPEQASQLQEARKKQRITIIRNFVDRESERPDFTLKSFFPSPTLPPPSDAADDARLPRKRKPSDAANDVRRPRKRKCNLNLSSSNVPKKKTAKRRARNMPICGDEELDKAFGDEVKNCNEDDVFLSPWKKSSSRTTNGHSTEENIVHCTTRRGKTRRRHCGKSPGSLPGCVESVEDWDNITLASLLSNKSKRQFKLEQNVVSHQQVTKPKDANMLINDGDDGGGNDDMTIACFLGNKSKKRTRAAKGLLAINCSEIPTITADDNEPPLSKPVEEQPVSNDAVVEPTNVNVEEDDSIANFMLKMKRKQGKRARIA